VEGSGCSLVWGSDTEFPEGACKTINNLRIPSLRVEIQTCDHRKTKLNCELFEREAIELLIDFWSKSIIQITFQIKIYGTKRVQLCLV
jgi:hypothetical protein